MIITTSTASTPICNPQLPPEIVMNAGALQPFAVRQVATPLPPLAPKTKPPLTMCGTTVMHLACSNTSSGIPLSGIPIISCITCLAQSSRSVASSRADAAQPAETQHRKYEHYFFHGTASFLYQCASLAFVLCVHSHADPHRYAGRTWTVLTVTNQDSGGLSNNAHLMYPD